MAQVTNTTQIDTIDILTAATVVEGSDLLFLQRGSVSHKIKKSDMKWGIGNLSDVLDSGDPDSNLDTKLVTEKRIKDYIDNIPPSSPEWIDLTGATHNLGYTGVIDKTYNIADFTGVGLNTSRIRMLFIYIQAGGTPDQQIHATYPDGVLRNIAWTTGVSGAYAGAVAQTVNIPIKEGQQTFQIKNITNLATFNLYAVYQY